MPLNAAQNEDFVEKEQPCEQDATSDIAVVDAGGQGVGGDRTARIRRQWVLKWRVWGIG